MDILIADDDKVIIKILKASLEGFGDSIQAVSRGDEAWEIVDQGEASLMITDWNMPGLSGVELIEKIRQSEIEDYVYMILLTGRSDKSDIIVGLEAGADDYLIKPFSVPELQARVSIGKRILNYQKRLRESQARLLRMATHDSLTGLLNRRALYEQLESELKRASYERTPQSVIMLDIDHFKDVNDTYGHLVGDKVLCLVAKNIKDCVRPYDMVGRWGGEEFLVVMRQTPEQEAVRIAERIRRQVMNSAYDSIEGAENLQLSVSGGVATFSSDTESWDLDDLIHRADMALYRSKQAGRNRVSTLGVIEEGS